MYFLAYTQEFSYDNNGIITFTRKYPNGMIEQCELKDRPFPLKYNCYSKMIDTKSSRFSVEFRPLDCKITYQGTTVTHNVKLDIGYILPRVCSPIGLTHGGWLPPPFCYYHRTIIADSNVASLFKSKNNIPRYNQQHLSSISFIESDQIEHLALNKTIRFNLFNIAFESNFHNGDARKFLNRHRELRNNIKSALPHVQLTPRSIKRDRMTLAFRTWRSHDLKLYSFCKEAYPYICTDVPDTDKKIVWQKLVDIYRSKNIENYSLMLLAVANCVFRFDKNKHINCRKLLKIGDKANITDKNIMNGISDISALSRLLDLNLNFPDSHATLLTSDKDMAYFWLSLNAERALVDGNKPGLRLDVDHRLIPKVYEHIVPEYIIPEMAKMQSIF